MGELKHGLVDGGVDLQVIEFDTDDLPRALNVLAELVRVTGVRVQNLWLGAPPVPGRDRLWFVTAPVPSTVPSRTVPFPPPLAAAVAPPMFAEV